MREQDYPDGDIQTGEKILESPITGNLYRVTKWVERGEGKFIALEKSTVIDTTEKNQNSEER